jgi:hypothetical protein
MFPTEFHLEFNETQKRKIPLASIKKIFTFAAPNEGD